MCETEKNSNSRAELLIATSNQAKLADFKLYLSDDYTVLGIDDIGIKLKIPEGIDSIEDNAIAKTRAYAVKTGLMCLGDDTGFFIKELNGEPGMALRRWGVESYRKKRLARNSGIICSRKRGG